MGSILGGRWSDRTLARLKAANDGKSYPEVCGILSSGGILTLATKFVPDAS